MCVDTRTVDEFPELPPDLLTAFGATEEQLGPARRRHPPGGGAGRVPAGLAAGARVGGPGGRRRGRRDGRRGRGGRVRAPVPRPGDRAALAAGRARPDPARRLGAGALLLRRRRALVHHQGAAPLRAAGVADPGRARPPHPGLGRGDDRGGPAAAAGLDRRAGRRGGAGVRAAPGAGHGDRARHRGRVRQSGAARRDGAGAAAPGAGPGHRPGRRLVPQPEPAARASRAARPLLRRRLRDAVQRHPARRPLRPHG